jgi:hypothetical protein
MTATLNGRLCSEVRVSLPRYGVWTAWATLSTGDPVSASPGGALLQVAGLPLVGTVTRQGQRNGLCSVEMVGGFGGWGRPVPPDGFRADNLVRLSTFAESLATATGERVLLPPGSDRKLGDVAARLGAVDAGALLSQVCAMPAGAEVIPWWVAPDGTTWLSTRPGLAVSARVVDVDPLGRAYEFAEDNALPLMPGATIDGVPIEELRVEVTGDAVREVAVVAAPGEEPDTFAARFRRLALRIFGPHVSARTLYRYVVKEVYADGRLRAEPVRSLLAPPLDGLRVWPGIAGGRCRPKPRSEVIVQFADGDPVASAACVVGFTPADLPTVSNPSPLGIPERAELDGDEVVLARGTKPAGRGGGKVSIMPYSPIPGTGAPLEITHTDPDGAPHVWKIYGDTSAGPVTFLVVADAGVTPVINEGVIDSGRAEVLV